MSCQHKRRLHRNFGWWSMKPFCNIKLIHDINVVKCELKSSRHFGSTILLHILKQTLRIYTNAHRWICIDTRSVCSATAHISLRSISGWFGCFLSLPLVLFPFVHIVCTLIQFSANWIMNLWVLKRSSKYRAEPKRTPHKIHCTNT